MKPTDEMNQYEFEEYNETRKIVSSMSSLVNRHNGQYFVELMSCEHRTLQQAFTRVVMQWIKHLAQIHDKGPGYYDLRNEASVKLAKQIYDKCGDKYIDCLPTI